MHCVSLISKAIIGHEDCPPFPEKTEIGICCVTGEKTQTISRYDLFGKSFTNLDVLRAPGSDRVGVDAYMALSFKWERMSSWLCNGVDFVRPTKKQLREWILNGVDSDIWAGYITTSYKKHGSLFVRINIKPFGIWRFENVTVDASDKEKNNEWYNVLNNFLHIGFGRTILESIECPTGVMKKLGVNQWLKLYDWARDKYKSPLYQLLCYVLPTQEELKQEKGDEYKQTQI